MGKVNVYLEQIFVALLVSKYNWRKNYLNYKLFDNYNYGLQNKIKIGDECARHLLRNGWGFCFLEYDAEIGLHTEYFHVIGFDIRLIILIDLFCLIVNVYNSCFNYYCLSLYINIYL